MGQDPRDIQARIEETREEMGDTVEALTHKADVPGRIRDSVSEKKDALTGKVTGAKNRVSGGSDGPGVSDRARYTARKGAGIARENPLGLAVGSVAAGFLVGMLLPSTRVEDERLGPMADQVKEQMRETGQDAVEHGKDLAQDVASVAAETARQSAGEHAEEIRRDIGQ